MVIEEWRKPVKILNVLYNHRKVYFPTINFFSDEQFQISANLLSSIYTMLYKTLNYYLVSVSSFGRSYVFLKVSKSVITDHNNNVYISANVLKPTFYKIYNITVNLMYFTGVNGHDGQA